MSRGAFVFFDTPVGFPRVSGDEPTGAGLLWQGIQFSPRERG